jgi:hypothetical protein
MDSRISLVSSGSWVSGASGLGTGVAEGDGTAIDSGISLADSGSRMAEGVGAATDSRTWLVDTTMELESAVGSTSDEDEAADETRMGDSSTEMVLDKGSPLSGTGVETVSRVEVSVRVGSASLALTMASEEDASDEVSELPPKSDSTNDVKSKLLDSSCSDELSGAKVEDSGVGVGVASAVVLAKICRFTCLGK